MLISALCLTAAVGQFLKCRDFFHGDFKNSSVGAEAASEGISRNSSEPGPEQQSARSAFGRGRSRARSRGGIWAGTRLCAVLRCLQDPCLVPAPPSTSRGGSVHPVLFTISLRGVGQALHSVSPQRSELKATKAHLLLLQLEVGPWCICQQLCCILPSGGRAGHPPSVVFVLLAKFYQHRSNGCF